MKEKTSFLLGAESLAMYTGNNLILKWIWMIIIALLIFTSRANSQQGQQTTELPIGAFLSENPSQAVLNSYDSVGFNTAAWRMEGSTQSFLEKYKVWANNAGQMDWIHYYATSYYSRWEAEQDTTIEHIGVKHKYGSEASWQGVRCWSTIGVTQPVCSLMYGPHYRQDQRYKSYQHTGNTWGVNYVPRFKMALDNPNSLESNRKICVLKVVYRFTEIYPPGNDTSYIVRDTVFLQDTLTIGEFPSDSTFKIFDFGGLTYMYPDKFRSAITGEKKSLGPAYLELPLPEETGFRYSDRDADNGIQFWVEYLGDDRTTLYIDWAEVYDNQGWNEFVNPFTQDSVINKIQAYTESYSNWNNIIYWYGQDEPYSQDSFTPIRIVDSLVQLFGGAPVVQYFQPDWNIVVNGDTFVVDYYRKAAPEELIIDPYPFSPYYNPVRVEDLEALRNVFQITSKTKPGFWFIGQGFGGGGIWRLPDSTELKATLMLSFAHGSKGLIFWNYDSYKSIEGIVDSNGTPSELWYLIKDNIVPRLKGNLGNTLLKSGYTGNYAVMRRITPTEEITYQNPGYLSLTEVTPGTFSYNFHAGLLKDTLDSDNDYFLLVNLLTNVSRSVRINLTRNLSLYNKSRKFHFN
jgi:hypothetical protein